MINFFRYAFAIFIDSLTSKECIAKITGFWSIALCLIVSLQSWDIHVIYLGTGGGDR